MQLHTTEWSLLLATLGCIVLLLVLILYVKIHAFLALLFSSILLALISGMSPQATIESLQRGMGDLLGSVAVIIAAGAVLGRVVEVTRAGETFANFLVSGIGQKRLPWAVLAFGYLIGIPVFYDVAFMTFIPLIWNITSIGKKSLLLYALPLIAALMTTTAFIPTNPGPAAAAQLLGADLGRTMFYGLAFGIPVAILGGIVYGKWIAARICVSPPEYLIVSSKTDESTKIRPPSVVSTLTVILLPVVLMGIALLLPLTMSSKSHILTWAKFIGHPVIALLITVAVAFVLLGVRSGMSGASIIRHTGQALNSVGSLILIIGASGAFRQVVIDSGAGNSLVKLVVGTAVSPLLMAYCITAVLRIASGSATASIATAAGLIAPVAQSFPNINRVLLVMAVALGGSVFSYVNDAGFWMVKEYCGLTVSQTIRSYSMMKLLASVSGLLLLLLVSHFM